MRISDWSSDVCSSDLRMRMVDGELVPVNLGVPFGAHARLVMLYIMTQSVKTKSREIFLGDSFSAWLRRMGIENTNSGGERASRTLVQEQVDRLKIGRASCRERVCTYV